MKKIRRLIWGGLLMMVFLVWPMKAEAVAKYYTDPVSGTYKINDTWAVVIKIDTQTQNVLSGDLLINFDKAKLQVVSVTAGSFFKSYSEPSIDGTAGTIRLSGDQGNAVDVKSGSGTMATINLKAIVKGTATLSMVCSAGQTTDSNILDPLVNDIIDCTATTAGNGSYTINETGGSAPTATPTPTPGGTNPTATPTPNGTGTGTTPTATPTTRRTTASPSLPVTGSIPETIGLLGLGVLTLTAGLALIL